MRHEGILMKILFINRKALLACILFLTVLIGPGLTKGICAETDNPLNLTPKELAWLKTHKKIRIGINKNWPPMDFLDYDGKPQGIGVDFIAELNKNLGNRLVIVPGTWKDIFDRVKKQKGLDALMDITPRVERQQWFNFTRPYVIVPQTIFSKGKRGKFYASTNDIPGSTIAVEKGFFLANDFRKGRWGKVKVKEYPTTSDALYAVSNGKADAYAGNQAVALYEITMKRIPGVHAQCKLASRGSVNAIGIRKDWPELVGILNKALNAIDNKTAFRILKYWGSKIPKNVKTKKDQVVTVKMPRPGYDWTVPRIGMEFVWIKQLECWVGKYEVTNAQYRKLESGHDSSAYKNYSLNGDEQPAAFISFKDAKTYADWLTKMEKDQGRLPLGYRYSLPTRQEWQTFVQCGDNRKYPWGNSWPPKYGNYHDRSGAGPWHKIEYYNDKYPVTCPVKESGKNDWGLYGVGGNLWEATIKSSSDGSFEAWRGASWRFGGTGSMKAPCEFFSLTAKDSSGRIGSHGFRLILGQRK